MSDETSIGPRLRALRKWRRMTLIEVADQAGMSKTHLSDIERGLKALDRRSYISGLASALRVSEIDIVGGPHLSADPVQAAPHAAVPAMRMALQTNTLAQPASEEARPLDELVEATRKLETVFTRCDYIELGKHLPGVIDELHTHVAMPRDEQAQRLALETLVEACMFATFRMKDLGYADLAYQAAARAEEAARLHGDPVVIGKAAYCRIQTMPREGTWDRIRQAAEKATNALTPTATDPVGRSVLGMLTLTASLASAVEHKLDTAQAWLDEAHQLATLLPDDPARNWSNFSVTNVGVWRVGIAVESGDVGGSVLQKAQVVDQGKLQSTRCRHASFLADVGRGLARNPKSSREALSWLLQAEKVAPQRIRNNNSVKETIGVLLTRAHATAVSRELRGMAARMGIPH
ncbi:helix-turn-helix domain-containing protein [Nonomuraea purpurea]|uniref:Helix-turn-helix domain-containing protein n=1 Tax=Nonomuraea purpurea TaxID=1849276 RepID=A0ABV8GQ91_9ACTN